MARSGLVPADTAQQWRSAVRAIDRLLHIEAAQGIASRTLRRRAQLSAAELGLLLELLRIQQIVTTVKMFRCEVLADREGPGPDVAVLVLLVPPVGHGVELGERVNFGDGDTVVAVEPAGWPSTPPFSWAPRMPGWQ
ncbi:hypothetical protein ACFVJM_37010 [Streptomyces virginiae]|uniref:hypothetical protein n=1 Tax=Streptomyces virginiae TaxID=1961 RepID=UPI00363C181B